LPKLIFLQLYKKCNLWDRQRYP